MKVSNIGAYITPTLILVALTGCLSKAPAASSISKVDSSLLPATAEQIQDDLKSSPNNPLALYNAVRQAGHNGLELAAYADLRKIVQADPDNSNLLAAYCLSFGVASGYYGMNGYHRALGNVYNENDQMEYERLSKQSFPLVEHSFILDSGWRSLLITPGCHSFRLTLPSKSPRKSTSTHGYLNLGKALGGTQLMCFLDRNEKR